MSRVSQTLEENLLKGFVGGSFGLDFATHYYNLDDTFILLIPGVALGYVIGKPLYKSLNKLGDRIDKHYNPSSRL
jgi:hypothetical protein